jgi:hypothetical protein
MTIGRNDITAQVQGESKKNIFTCGTPKITRENNFVLTLHPLHSNIPHYLRFQKQPIMTIAGELRVYF